MSSFQNDSTVRGGILNIHKPSWLTSFEVVRTVRKLLGEKKVGHCGTLDPMACGVLVVLYGSATALSEKLAGQEKRYRAKMQMGIRTDTGDITGKIIERLPVPELQDEQIQQVFKNFCGSIQQMTPLYSAVKREGKKLYEYARQGIPISAPKRFVEIYSLELLSLEKPFVEFRVSCSKGTYIRSLAEDLGKEFGTCATLTELIREKSGSFVIQESIPWESLRNMTRVQLLSRAQVLSGISPSGSFLF